MEYKNYINGLDMKQFKPIKEISHYNWNYYIGFENDLLFEKSDDDDTSEWYIILGNNKIFLGLSYTSKGDILEVYDEVPC